MGIKIDDNSKITLTLKKQKLREDSFVVGDETRGTFVELPQEAIHIIDLCDGTRTIKEIQSILEMEMDEVYDVKEFISDLYEINLVYKINDHIILKRDETQHFRLTKFIAHLFFTPRMHSVYSLVIFANICMMFFVKGNLPDYKNVEIIDGHSGLSLVLFTLISIVVTVFHEIGHYLSAVDLQIPVKIKLSLRLFYLVVETDINSIWGIDRNKRYICYLAGFYTENVILFVTILIKKLCFIGNLGNHICDAIILIVFLNFVWQLMIFLRTDFYFIILNYLNVPALHFSAMQSVRGIGKSIKKKTDKKELIYLVIYFIGVIASILYLFNEFLIYVNLFLISFNNFEINFDNICFGVLMFLHIALWGKGAYNKYIDYRMELNAEK
jgi:hypothetical protein